MNYLTLTIDKTGPVCTDSYESGSETIEDVVEAYCLRFETSTPEDKKEALKLASVLRKCADKIKHRLK